MCVYQCKEVDEENSESEVSEERRRRPDLLHETLGRQFAESRRRRARRDLLREREAESPPPEAPAAPTAPAPPPAPPHARTRASSEPADT